MLNITNPRIEKKRAEIAKTKVRLAELQEKLREQERQLRQLEDAEIVAMFRSENMDDEHLEKLREQDSPVRPEPLEAQTRADTNLSATIEKEEFADDTQQETE